jgi:hypothetical protein
LKVPVKAGGGSSTINVFVFSCPENVPIRMKMTMSSSKVFYKTADMINFSHLLFNQKASVIAAADELAVVFDRFLFLLLLIVIIIVIIYHFSLAIFNRFIEIRGADDLDELIQAEINPTACGAAESASASSASANISHSKPSRPGKPGSKTKVNKFTIEE